VNLALGLLLGLLPLASAAWLWSQISHTQRFLRRVLVAVTVAGALLGALSFHLERLLLGWAELPTHLETAPLGAGLLAIFLVKAPLQEGLKVLPLWPLFATGRIMNARAGVLYSAVAAAGFASTDAVLGVAFAQNLGLALARGLFAVSGHLFFAGLWGSALGFGGQQRGRWFALAWLGATSLHGLFSYLVFARGPGVLLLCIPLVLFMAVLAYAALRDVAPEAVLLPEALRSWTLQAPSLSQMRGALKRQKEPLALFWIAVGVFVTFGVMLGFVAMAVYVGRQMGVDFSLADEADVRSSGPLVLLGGALLGAFPAAGFLVARASGRATILEAAIATGIAITLLIVVLSITAPIAVVFALAVAPVAFTLACGGAWFGVSH